MRIRLGIIFSLMSLVANAQWIEESSDASIEFRSETYANSNSVNQHFINSLFFDLEVDDEDIQRNMNRIRANAKLGVVSMHSLNIKLDQTAFGLKISDHRYASLRADGELFSLALQGNSAFENDTIGLGNTAYQVQSFQEIALNYEFAQSSGPLNLSLSYLNAGTGEFGRVKSGSFYTAPLGSELWIDLDAEFRSSDSIKRQVLPSNGHGVSVGFRKDWKKLSKEHDLKAFVSVQNFGFIRWTSSTSSRKIDRQYRFTPSDYNIASSESEVIRLVLQDTLNAYAPEKANTHSQLSPFRIDLGMSHRAESGHAVWQNKRSFGLQYIYLPGYVPRFWYREYFAIGSQVEAFASTGFGGFGSLFLGLGLQMEVEHFRISGNLSNIAGLALPNHTAGLGASIQLTYLF